MRVWGWFVTYVSAQQVILNTYTRNLERVFCSTASYLYDMRFNKELRLGTLCSARITILKEGRFTWIYSRVADLH